MQFTCELASVNSYACTLAFNSLHAVDVNVSMHMNMHMQASASVQSVFKRNARRRRSTHLALLLAGALLSLQ